MPKIDIDKEDLSDRYRYSIVREKFAFYEVEVYRPGGDFGFAVTYAPTRLTAKMWARWKIWRDQNPKNKKRNKKEWYVV